MSLIKCPECGRQVSTKAPYCPGCGVPIQNNVKRCPICNELVLMDAEECPQCHAHFVVKKQAIHNLISSHAGNPLAGDKGEPTEERDPDYGAAKDYSGYGTAGNDTNDGTALGATGYGTAEDDSNYNTAEDDSNYGTTEDDTDDSPAESKEQMESYPGNGSANDGDNHKSGNTPWWLLLIAIIVLALGGFYYYECQQHEVSEEKDFERLKDCSEQTTFQDFLNRYPDSRHAENVRARLEELQRIEEEWTVVSKNLNIMQLQAFVDKYPSSVHKAEATHKIDSLDWREADRKGTEAAYALYIGRHEHGDYIQQAYVARDQARRRETQARQDSLEAAQNALRDSLSLATTGIPAAQ
ncbi:MAG: zinc ribbon domain-containing protein [Bacteroidaceae bacterium]|nr:zinc ribbon domain-containing protein [Bacteroidaceae bacterium]